MVINDFEKDAERLVEESGLQKIDICRKMGVTRSAYYDYIKDAKVTEKYVVLAEAMGYDIEVEYIKGKSGILTDFVKDANELSAESGYTKVYLAKSLGISLQLLRGHIVRANITKRYVDLCGVLGYGLRLRYIPFEK